MKRTEWIFIFDYETGDDFNVCWDDYPVISCDSYNPHGVKFITSKSQKEIKEKFGGIDHDYGNGDSGLTLLSIWYFDEYTEDNSDLGHYIVNKNAECDCFKIPKKQQITKNQIIKCFKKRDSAIYLAENFPVIDLDDVLKQKPIKDHGCYRGTKGRYKDVSFFDIWHKKEKNKTKKKK